MDIFRNNKGRLPLLMIIIGVVVLGLGAGGFMFFRSKTAHAAGKQKVKKVDLTPWVMGEFMVTLADTGELRYLKCEMTLEVEKDGKAEPKAEGKEGGNPQEAKARDIVISILSGKTVNDLLADKTKSQIKDEIKEALNKGLEGTKVHDVYFTSFAMQ